MKNLLLPLLLISIGSQAQFFKDSSTCFNLIQLNLDNQTKEWIVLDQLLKVKKNGDTTFYSLKRSILKNYANDNIKLNDLEIFDVDKRVYASGSIGSLNYEALLLYDFNLQAGDTFTFIFPNVDQQRFSYVIDSVSDKSYLNGESYTTQFITPLFETIDSNFFISQNLGTSQGFLSFMDNMLLFDNKNRLNTSNIKIISFCTYESNEYRSVYSSVSLESCEKDSILNQFTSKFDNVVTPIELYIPNPVKSELNLDNIKPDEVLITSSNGKLVASERNNLTNIDISFLPAGLYYIYLKIDDQWIVGKVVKL